MVADPGKRAQRVSGELSEVAEHNERGQGGLKRYHNAHLRLVYHAAVLSGTEQHNYALPALWSDCNLLARAESPVNLGEC